jgi:hypothetical protein
VTGPRPVLVLGDSLNDRRAQERKRDATSGTVPARALDSDFATASTHPLLHQRLCPRLHHSFHFRLTKTFVHLRLPLPTSLAHLQPLIGIATAYFRGNRLIPFASANDAPLKTGTNYLNLAMRTDLWTDLGAAS